MKMIHTDQAPQAIGPYAQAVTAGNVVYTSGQIALDPVTGMMVGEDARTQAVQCLSNLEAVLKAAGSGTDSILKVTIYLKSMNDFVAVNDVYSTWLGAHRPARSTVAVAGLPRGALVEIECVAEHKG